MCWYKKRFDIEKIRGERMSDRKWNRWKQEWVSFFACSYLAAHQGSSAEFIGV